MAQELTYQIIIEKNAQKDAEKIPVKYRSSIDKAITDLSSDPRPHGSKKLTGKEGYRVRAGNYRILYTIDDKAKIVVIYKIKIRSEATYR
ncbi:MAG: type II toxin-antitoxin system RelE/ParE family toxin [Nitrospirae bacterium]|nr:MAG: type II toxin-antitoxin system RelE/ParE family toxin [Nitrospirota bacterium]